MAGLGRKGIRRRLLRGGLLGGGLLRSGRLGTTFKQLLGLSEPLVVAYEGNNPLETGRYPQPTTVLKLAGGNQHVFASPVVAGIVTGEAYFKLDTGANSHANYIFCGDVHIESGLLRVNAGGTLQLANPSVSLVHSNAISENVWHHVQWSIGGGVATVLTLDGVEETAAASTNGTASNNYLIGVLYNAANGFEGVLSNVVINDSRYPLNQTSGTVALDRNDNANHGTLINGASWVVDNTLPWQADSFNNEGGNKTQTITSTAGGGVWGNSSAGCTAISSGVDDYDYSFLAPTRGGESMNGLSHDPTASDNFTDIDHALYLNPAGAIFIYENGVSKGSHGAYLGGEVLSIRRIAGAVTYYKDDALIYTSLLPASGELYPDVAFRVSGVELLAAWLNGSYVSWDYQTAISEGSFLIPPSTIDPTKDCLGNDLQWAGSVYPIIPVPEGSSALRFDGVNQYCVTKQSGFSYDLPFSLCIYFNSSNTSNVGYLFYKGYTSGDVSQRSLVALFNVGTLRVSVGAGAEYVIGTANQFRDGNWHKLNIVSNGSTFETFIDDVSYGVYNVGVNPSGGDLDDIFIGCRRSALPVTSVATFFDGTVSGFSIKQDGGDLNLPLTETSGTTVIDTSGNGNHGTLVNGPTWVNTRDGYGTNLNQLRGFSGRMLFDGIDDYVITPLLPMASGSIEVEFTKKPNTIAEIIFGARDSADTRCYLGVNNTGEIAGGIGDHFNTTIKGTTILEDDTFYTGKISWDGTTVSLYLNDVLEYSGPQSGSVGNTQGFFVGSLNNAGAPLTFTNQSVKSIRVYNATGSVVSAWNSYGNTDEHWIDQVGNNDGTVIGSPDMLRIPPLASNPTVDARDGLPLTNPPVLPYGHNAAENTENGYNLCEDGSVPSAAAELSLFDTIFFGDTRNDLQNTIPVDAGYRRDKSPTIKDRLLLFRSSLFGKDKDKAVDYTNPK